MVARDAMLSRCLSELAVTELGLARAESGTDWPNDSAHVNTSTSGMYFCITNIPTKYDLRIASSPPLGRPKFAEKSKIDWT